MNRRVQGLRFMGTALMLAFFAACAMGPPSGNPQGCIWPPVPHRLQGQNPVALELALLGEQTKLGSSQLASIWGELRNPDCCPVDRPLIILLRGPGLPPEGVRSQPEDPWSENGGFRFFNLPPGEYHLSLQVAPGQDPPLLKSDNCTMAIPLKANDVVVHLLEGESKEIDLALVWNEFGPHYQQFTNWGRGGEGPRTDYRSTTSGATIPDTMFQNIPLGPPPDR